MTSEELQQAVQKAVDFIDSLSDAEIESAMNAGVLDRMYGKLPRKKLTLLQRCIARGDDLSRDSAYVLSSLEKIHYSQNENGIMSCPECGVQWPCLTYVHLHARDDA